MKALTLSAAVLAAGALALGLTGCGGAAEPAAKPKAEAVAEVAPETIDPGEFMDGIIEAQLAAGSAVMTMAADSAAGSFATDASIVFGDGGAGAAMQMEMQVEGQAVSLIIADGQFFVRLPQLTGDRWMFIDPADASNPFASMASAATSDPAAQASEVRDAATAVELVGEEEVDGITATHYLVTVDPTLATGATGAQLAATGLTDPIVYDYWLDADGLPARIESTVEAAGTSVTTTVTMHDWGTVAPITAPTNLVTPAELGLVG